MTRTDLLALAERVEAGSGADLRLAHDIWVEFGGTKRDIVTSLDAVEALRERLLPGSFIGVETVLYAPVAYRAWVRMTEHANSLIGLGRAPTEPRAKLAALLRVYAETVGG